MRAKRAASERWLQTCIEAAIDLNSHLLVGLGHPAPADGYRSFLDLADRTRIIDADFAATLAPSAGLATASSTGTTTSTTSSS